MGGFCRGGNTVLFKGWGIRGGRFVGLGVVFLVGIDKISYLGRLVTIFI